VSQGPETVGVTVQSDVEEMPPLFEKQMINLAPHMARASGVRRALERVGGRGERERGREREKERERERKRERPAAAPVFETPKIIWLRVEM